MRIGAGRSHAIDAFDIAPAHGRLAGCARDQDQSRSRDRTRQRRLRAILATLKRVRQSEGDLRLCSAPKSVTKVLEMSGITGLLKSFATLDEAVASYAG